MFSDPKFTQGGFSIIFPRKPEIRRLANQLEDVLRGQYNQPTILGVPDEFEPEVPRLIFSSTHGFSQLAISQVSIALNVNFSPDFQINSESRYGYFEEKLPRLFEVLRACEIDNPNFVGHSLRVRIEGFDVTDAQILQKLNRLLLRSAYAEALVDIEIKRTEIVEQKYYSNITIANYRDWLNESPQSAIVRRPYRNSVGRGIQAVFDYNDRFAFSEQDDYLSSQETALETIVRANNTANDTCQMLLGGEV